MEKQNKTPEKVVDQHALFIRTRNILAVVAALFVGLCWWMRYHGG